MTRWIYVFYRGDDVDFVGDQQESIDHYKITKEHLQWLSYQIAKKRAEAQPDSRKLFAIRVDPDKLEEGRNHASNKH